MDYEFQAKTTEKIWQKHLRVENFNIAKKKPPVLCLSIPGADLGFFTHQSNAEGVSHARGVWGHAPPGKF